MPRKSGPERAHFGGELGLVTETTSNGNTKHFWHMHVSSCKIVTGDGSMSVSEITHSSLGLGLSFTTLTTTGLPVG